MMNVEDYIKEGGFWLAEGPVHINLSWPWVLAFKNAHDYFKYIPKRIFGCFGKDYAWQYIKISETVNTGSALIKYEKLKNGFIKRKIKISKNLAKKLDAQIRKIKNLSEKSDKQLGIIFKDFYDVFVKFWDSTILCEGVGIYVEEVLIKKLQNELTISKSGAQEIVSVMTTPLEKSFIAEEHEDLLKLCILYSKKSKKFKTELKKHQKRFFWVRNNYTDVKPISEKEFFDLIKKDLKKKTFKKIKEEYSFDYKRDSKKKKKAVLGRYKISRDLLLELKAFEQITLWQDFRKSVSMRANYYLELLYKEFQKRSGLKDYHLALPGEVLTFFRHNKKPSVKDIKKRKNLFLFVIFSSQKKIQLFTGKKASRIHNLLKNTFKTEMSNEVRGMPTLNLPTIKGRVRIVLDVKKTKFKKGEILVTSMTRPEFVPLMKKAKGFITNEGGITCHAAIVSREMKKPCIIGTKIATRVLKNGDLVEIDTKRGIVRKL